MTKIGLYTATENEVGALQEAAGRLDDVEPVVRSEGDLDGQSDVAEFVEQVEDAACVVLWLHGAEDSMPGYDYAVGELEEAGVPLVVKATGDAFAIEDTTVSGDDRDSVYSYLERGGTVNLANMMRYLAGEYDERDLQADPPKELPTEGVYHPDHPGADVEDLLAELDPDTPTVGIWFYESHWTHENTRYVDAQVRAVEERGADALPVFCNPASDGDGQEDARWTARNIFTRDGEVVVDAVLSSFMFSMAMSERGRGADDEGDVEAAFLDELDVPVLQTVTTMRSRSRYHASDTGVMGFELALSVALPEFDGNVVTHPISGKEATEDRADIGSAAKQHHPIEGRVEHAAELAVNWANLRYTPKRDRKVAVVLHNYPPRDDGIGTAFGLDTPASTVNLLQELDRRGYSLGGSPPAEGDELIDRLTSQLTLDSRWIAPEDVRERAVDVVETDTYDAWLQDADQGFQDAVVDEWGDPPGRPFAIPGVELGNVLVTVQPPRGFGMDPEKIYHDSDLQPPHDYYAFYSWIKNEFQADAVVHMGTHGSLEWLPGKTVGLDDGCAPDALVRGLPNVYPYIVNNPGEGTQAKRRSYAAVVDHLTPPMRRADSYGELAELEELARSYREAGAEARTDRDQVADAVREKVDDLDLAVELGVEGSVDEKANVRGPEEAGSTLAEGDVDGDVVDDEELVERVHSYVTDVRDTQIRMGLHSFGEPPESDRLVDYLVALTRLENAGAPSLRESVAGVLGVPYQKMLDQPERYDDDLGMTLSEAADHVHDVSRDLVETLADEGFSLPETERDTGDGDVNMNLLVVDLEPLGDGRARSCAHDDLREVVDYICTEVAPRVLESEAEVYRAADALDGRRVPPGGSGAPTRGGVDLLPTGRNFYTLDPRKVPARSAWEVGRRVAEQTLDRHLEDEGGYPEEVGVVAWGTPTVRTRGETIAEVLALMGVEPRWTDAGRVDDVEPIPLEELDRPRVDVTTRVSGLFRDAFPQAASVVHDAVEAVVDLDEPHDMNYVKKHVEQEEQELVEEGVDEDDARDAALHRVFTTRPGGYGAGTNKAVDEGEWEDRGDLSEVYTSWGGYALGSRGKVEEARESFERRLSNVDATLKTEDTMEQDEFDSSDWYAFHGGFITAVTEHSGEEPASYVGDTSDPDNPTVYTNEEKVRKAMRARVLNPDWLDSMEEHGYKGAGDLSQTVDVVLGWDATTGVVSDTLWRDVAERYVFDDDRRGWMLDVNPWAVENVTDTLMEAVDRGLWSADDDVVDRLRDLNLEADGRLEEQASREKEVVAGGD